MGGSYAYLSPMKRLLCLVAIVASSFSVRAQGLFTGQPQDTVVWSTSVALMPLSFLGSGLELAYEIHIPNSYNSIRINAGGFLATNPWFYDNYSDYGGFRGEIQYRFHLLRQQYQRDGFYLGPYAQFKYLSMKGSVNTYVYDPNTGNGTYVLENLKTETNAMGLGVLIGYQERMKSRFVIDVYGGGGFLLPSSTPDAARANLGFVNPYNRGIQFHGGLGIGFLPRKRIVR